MFIILCQKGLWQTWARCDFTLMSITFNASLLHLEGIYKHIYFAISFLRKTAIYYPLPSNLHLAFIIVSFFNF